MAVSFCSRRLQSYLRNRKYHQYYSTGYVVLLPEIGLNIPDENPLLKDGVPDFSDITPEKCVNTLGKSLLDLEHEVFAIDEDLKKRNEVKTDQGRDYSCDFIHSVVQPLQQIGTALDVTWGIVKTIFIVDSDKLSSAKYLSLHSRAHSAQYVKFSSKAIFEASKECDLTKLSEEEQRVVERYQIEGTLSGLGLSENDNEAFNNITRLLHKEKLDFNRRLQVSRDLYDVKIADPYVVRDFPATLLENMTQENKDPTQGPWVASIGRHMSNKFLEYCPDHRLRQRLWKNRMTIASLSIDHSELQNSTSLEQIREYRREQARLLGYPNYSSLSMETKMAGTLDNAFTVLESLREQAFPAHKEEIESLQEFANKSGFKGKLKESDVLYWTRKHKKALYNFENEELRDYFIFDKVLNGLIKLCEDRFGIRIEEVNKFSTWHPDVKTYYIFEDDNVRPIASFYIDPFTRPEKLRSDSEGGWLVNIRSAAHLVHDTNSLPLTAMILNFAPPIYGKPSLLSYSEVKSLFEKLLAMIREKLSQKQEKSVKILQETSNKMFSLTDEMVEQLMSLKNKVTELVSLYDNVKYERLFWDSTVNKIEEITAREGKNRLRVKIACWTMYLEICEHHDIPVTLERDETQKQLGVIENTLLLLQSVLFHINKNKQLTINKELSTIF